MLEVIGDGPQRHQCEALAERLGVDRRIAFHGFRPHADVLELLRRSDVLVMPSLTATTGQAEALGNVAKEALAVGLEVAATNNGGIPETVPPELRDELVPEKSPAALADRLVELWRDRDQWSGRAERGRRWVEETFDWRKLAPLIAAVYRDAAGERTGGRDP
jgi:colanic acid/amylovoran biosynthesis glycosyltransferase